MSEKWSHIKDSGLLELYALGELDVYEKADVEAALAQSSALREELLEIERALMNYAHMKGVDAPASVKDKIISELGSPSLPVESVPSNKTGAGIGSFILGLKAA